LLCATLICAVVLAACAVPEVASAQPSRSSAAPADDDRLAFLSEKLASTDARVRTSAALALGATNRDEAAETLCGVLGDSEEVVRHAAAAALRKLGRRGVRGKIAERLEVEPSARVKKVLELAIAAMSEPSGSPAESDVQKVALRTPRSKNAEYYVAIAGFKRPSAHVQRSAGDVALQLTRAMRKRLEETNNVRVAPASESAGAARDVLTRERLRGFFVNASVTKFELLEGTLRVDVEVAVLTYPGKSLLGTFSRSLVKSGVSEVDPEVESEMLDLAGRVASDTFANNAARFN